MTVKYFGKIAEVISVAEEEWNYDRITVSEFKKQLLLRYPLLENETIQIAANLVIVNPDFLINEGDKIAILPPYSGG